MKARVYYADTDAGGVVYYANYLRWLEIARWEFVARLGLPVHEYDKRGIIFAVVRVEIDYRAPAVLGDEVEIETTVESVRRVRFALRQRVVRFADREELVTAVVKLACVNREGKVTALPAELAAALRNCAAG